MKIKVIILSFLAFGAFLQAHACADEMQILVREKNRFSTMGS